MAGNGKRTTQVHFFVGDIIANMDGIRKFKPESKSFSILVDMSKHGHTFSTSFSY